MALIDLEESEHRATILTDLRDRMDKLRLDLALKNAPWRDQLQGYRDLFRMMRERCKDRWGVEFPRMTVVALPSVPQFEFVRASYDRASVEQLVINLTVKYPRVSMAEIAMAVHQAFPDYKPEFAEDAMGASPVTKAAHQQIIH